jgi:hypothetical protein
MPIELLLAEQPLPPRYKDHPLKLNWAGYQGNCISKHLQKFAEEGIIPSGAFEFSAQGAF